MAGIALIEAVALAVAVLGLTAAWLHHHPTT